MAPTVDELDQRLKQLEQDCIPLITQYLVPTGTVVPFAGSRAPSGWLLCDGSAIGRVEYTALFDVILDSYGPGDGATTFNLPDLRGRTPIGSGQGVGLSDRMIGEQIGDENHTLSADEMPLHSHSGSSEGAGAHAHSASTSGAGNHSHAGSTGGSGAHSHSGSTVEAGQHDHNFRVPSGFSDGRDSGLSAEEKDFFGKIITVSQSGNHTHGVNIEGVGDHTHGITIDGVSDHIHGVAIDGVGDHTHGVTIEAAGEGQSHNNLQPSLVCNFIIKV